MCDKDNLIHLVGGGHIISQEGPHALFKGLGPTLLGVAPSRAIYFWTYSSSKKLFNEFLSPDSHQVHLLSAACGGFMSSTLTNPIWFVKTRLQLDKGKYKSVADCIKKVYYEKGIPGFYRGITASYFGICETALHFVIYESIKKRLDNYKVQMDSPVSQFEEDEWVDVEQSSCPKKSLIRFLEYMGAGATSKTIASCVAYPHEVARTRLREEGSRHSGFINCLINVYREDGYRGLYRGLGTHLIRQIPNTAIVLATYEGCVYLYTRYNESSVETN
ncbi:hypothetical protein QYM36_007938 [Artemia franciscana]|uniref:Uncharacterized protein n=1 Tax=Artemia franciscana TaxID=6661 RepID=A0AA88LM08_ARTSF|nr:hypothetical protein QYM36_007938 [Artemia franciscana]